MIQNLWYRRRNCSFNTIGFTLPLRSLSGFELADDLLGCVMDSSYGGVLDPVWPDEDSHLPWIDSQAPGHSILRSFPVPPARS